MKIFPRAPRTHLFGAATMIAATALPAAASPVETILHNFGVVHGGSAPQSSLIAGPDGSYYGTNDLGGATGNGVVFTLVPPSAAGGGWTEKVIHAFSGAPDGANPSSGLLAGGGGVLYGVTGNGGPNNAGVVFKLTPPASGSTQWAEEILYSFTGTADGTAPFGALVMDGHGVLYGSTAGGGDSNGSGVVFSLAPPQAGGTGWTETTLYTFQGGTDGASPSAGLSLDKSGRVFGMTSVGGQAGAGTVYRLTPPMNGGSAWTKATVYSFAGQADGGFPTGALVRDANGIFYGSTFGGGSAGDGTIFSLTPPAKGGTGWSETVLYSFTGGNDGGSPDAVVLGPDGTVYGAGNAGGKSGAGVVFSLSPPAKANASWTEAVLASLDGSDGSNPTGLLLDPSGALVASAFSSGSRGGGTALMLTPPPPGQTGWSQAVLYAFAQSSKDASAPSGALQMSRAGVIYGSAENGGTHGDGAVFQLTPPAAGGTAWTSTVLHDFTGPDGALAIGKLLEGKGGVLYGVTNAGGSKAGYGTVYALTPPGNGQTKWGEQVLHAFQGVAAADGAFPNAGMIADSDGALYGTTSSGGVPSSDSSIGNGTVFKLTPPAAGKTAWTETVLHEFLDADGSNPIGTLLLDNAGALYGTTTIGGSAGEGTVFKLSPPAKTGGQWTDTVLHSFNASVGNDGAIPGTGQLLADADGALYGTTSQGGALGYGTVFKLTPPKGSGTKWKETLIHSFVGTDGIGPFVGLLASPGGALYGVAGQGGNLALCDSPFGKGCGTVFKLTPAADGPWPITVLHTFDPSYNRDGVGPSAALIRDKQGNLFGSATGGGFGGGGIVFEVTP